MAAMISSTTTAITTLMIISVSLSCDSSEPIRFEDSVADSMVEPPGTFDVLALVDVSDVLLDVVVDCV
jgi:hypothetical protein